MLTKARTYLITPRDAVEAAYGKATLLTDLMIAQILDALKNARAQADEGQELLWRKLMKLWGDEKCPYEDKETTA